MPSLLPPPEFRSGELAKMGLTGTCELQICRSAGPWSLGTPGKIERSIQNAYLKGVSTSSSRFLLRNDPCDQLFNGLNISSISKINSLLRRKFSN
jgi:phospholipase D1/2